MMLIKCKIKSETYIKQSRNIIPHFSIHSLVDIMANQMGYITVSNMQQQSTLILLDQFAEDLKKISGKCIELGCGPGNITSSLLLPSLGPDATIVGKKMTNFGNQ